MNLSKVPADVRSVDGWAILSVEDVGHGTVFRYAHPEIDAVARVCFSRFARTREHNCDEDGSLAVISRELKSLLKCGPPVIGGTSPATGHISEVTT